MVVTRQHMCERGLRRQERRIRPCTLSDKMMATGPFRRNSGQKGVQENGQKRCGERSTVNIVTDEWSFPRSSDEDIRKLANLGEAQAHQQCGPEGIAKKARNRRPNHELADYNEGNDSH